MNKNKLENIHQSFINGQKSQMVDQIKAYGVSNFHIDFWEYISDYEFTTTRATAEYTTIVLTYHKVNQARTNRR